MSNHFVLLFLISNMVKFHSSTVGSTGKLWFSLDSAFNLLWRVTDIEELNERGGSVH